MNTPFSSFLVIALIVAAGLLPLGLYLNSAHKRLPVPSRSFSIAFYVIGLVIYCAALYVGSQLNPRDQTNGSWSDPYLHFASWAGFILCLIAPLFSKRPWPARIGFLILGLPLLAVAFFMWWATTA